MYALLSFCLFIYCYPLVPLKKYVTPKVTVKKIYTICISKVTILEVPEDFFQNIIIEMDDISDYAIVCH